MQIRFHGAVNGHVTGSCTEFYYKRTNTRFLVDCGMVQGEAHAAALNARPFAFDPGALKFVLLTHAHLDHCGLIPKLYKDGFRGKVICTRATAAATEAILMDSAGLPDSPYDRRDVALVRFDAVDERPQFGPATFITIDDDLRAVFLRSAHLPGSSSICLGWLGSNEGWRQMVMSGDLGPNTKANPYQSLLSGRLGICGYPDCIVLESTYGDRERNVAFADREVRLRALEAVVRSSLLEREGPLVIPAFAMHRTQELLFDLFCLFGREGSPSLLSYPLMKDVEFEKLLAGKTISQEVFVSLKKVILEHGGAESGALISAFQERVTKRDAVVYGLGPCTTDMVEALRLHLTKTCVAQPLIVVLESALASKISGVYRSQLNTRQIKNSDEPMWRNRKLKEWLCVCSEEEVDKIIEQLFGCASDSANGASVRLGGLLIRSGSRFKFKDGTTPRPTIVISSGGMCEGGPVVNLLPEALKRVGVTVAVTGFMSRGSTGAKIVELLSRPQGARSGKLQFTVQEQAGNRTVEREVQVEGKDVRAGLADLRGYYSGHADVNGLCDFALTLARPEKDKGGTRPVRILLNHGSDEARRNLKRVIEERAGRDGRREVASVEFADSNGRWLEIESGRYLLPEEGIEDKLNRLIRRQEKLEAMLAAMQERLRPSSWRGVSAVSLPSLTDPAFDARGSGSGAETEVISGGGVYHRETSASEVCGREPLVFCSTASPISDEELDYVGVKRAL